MDGLTAQLQADAINPDVPVSSLLRKVKLAAVKLQRDDVLAWADSELKGYESEVPEYRKIRGQPKARDPRSGWIPFVGNAEFIELISEMPAFEAITSLEETVRDPQRTSFYLQFPPQIVERLNHDLGTMCPEMAIHVQRSTIVSILEHVRTLILEWAIELERNGILGEGLGFNVDEKKKASTAHINIGTFSGTLMSNTGDATGPAAKIMLGSQDASPVAFGDNPVFGEIEQAIKKSVENTTDREELLSLVTAMRSAEEPTAFSKAYGAFISRAADYMGLIGPFIPALTALLAS